MIDYLRISVTDRCNLRCVYCMPESGILTRPHEELLSLEEIARLAAIFASAGINKVRLTGGEPLVRSGIVGLVSSLARIDGIKEVCLTTNGILLKDYAAGLSKAGLKSINISLDTLREDRFGKITRNGSLRAVTEGIEKAREGGLERLKINTVIMKGINDDEILDFAEFSLSRGLVLRFIEFMKNTPLWRADYFVPVEKIKAVCEKKFKLRPARSADSGPAVYYEVEGRGALGFISTRQKNCLRCNRLRLTSTGELKVCLYENSGVSLKDLLRGGSSDWRIREVVNDTMGLKGIINYKKYLPNNNYMYTIGG